MKIDPTEAPSRAVVLCAGMNGLGAVRSLGIAGVPVTAVALSADEPVLRSHYGQKLLIAGDGGDTEDQLFRELLRIGRKPDILLPTSDKFVSFIARNRASLDGSFLCCIPSDATIQVLIDKADETRFIQDLGGIPMPKTVQSLPANPSELVAQLGLPLILKPRTSVISRDLHIKTNPLYDSESLAAWYQKYAPEHLSKFIAQELIPGGDGTQWECICVFDEQHKLVSCFIFRKIRTAPPGFGVTCFAKSEWNPALADIAARLGAGLGYVGPADFDFKYDSREGTYKYLETNPRLGMVNYFGAACGVNPAYDTYRAANQWKMEPSLGTQQDGRFFLSFFDDMYGRIGGPRKSLRTAIGVFWEYFRLAFQNTTYAYLDRKDPRPGLWEARQDCRKVLKSIGRKLNH